MPDTALAKAAPTAPQPVVPKLSKPQKAAVLIGALGSQSARPFLETLDEAGLRHFVAAMSTLRQIRPDTVHVVIDEFLAELETAGLGVAGGMGHVRELLKDYVSDAVMERIMGELSASDAQDVWRDIIAAPPEALCDILTPEHAQIAAIVLARLPAERAAAVLASFNPDHARDVVVALNENQLLADEVLGEIGTVLHEALRARPRQRPVPPSERIGAIMNFTPGPVRDHILSHFEGTMPDVSAAIRRKMFTFNDIPARISPRDIGSITQSVTEETLLRALAGAAQSAPETHEFILGNLSKRMAAQLEEAMGELGTVKPAEADAAQLDILRIIRRMVDSAEITLIDPPDEAQDD
ncbi:MAG: FliG C-terminal domain-containing protein [Paracoccaceae bacterium]